jgi:hypothetical protein
MDTAEKVRESRIRRMADRQGYKLMRSRARDPRDITYGGYHLVDHQVGGVAFGYGNANRDYAASLDDVEAWLTGDNQKTELQQRSRR